MLHKCRHGRSGQPRGVGLATLVNPGVAGRGGEGPHGSAWLAHRDQVGVLVAATDADAAGERYAAHLAEIAQAAGLRSERFVPSGGPKDWYDALK